MSFGYGVTALEKDQMNSMCLLILKHLLNRTAENKYCNCSFLASFSIENPASLFSAQGKSKQAKIDEVRRDGKEVELHWRI